MANNMTKEEAIAFFSKFYGGEHHFPKAVEEFGSGWCMKGDMNDFSTYDHNRLTRLVLMAHDNCVRASIQPNGPRGLKICIWKRDREGGLMHRHPTIEEAIERYRKTGI